MTISKTTIRHRKASRPKRSRRRPVPSDEEHEITYVAHMIPVAHQRPEPHGSLDDAHDGPLSPYRTVPYHQTAAEQGIATADRLDRRARLIDSHGRRLDAAQIASSSCPTVPRHRP